MNIMGMDPGKVSFAWAVVNIRPDDWTLLGCDLLRHPMDSFGETVGDANGKSVGMNTLPHMAVLKSELKNLLADYTCYSRKPVGVIIERYANRNTRNSNMNELLPMAIGMIMSILRNEGIRDMSLIQASTWKNALGGNNGNAERRGIKRLHAYGERCFKEKYETRFESRAALNKMAKMVPHVTDAVIMALMYGSAKVTGDRLKHVELDSQLETVIDRIVGILGKSIK